MRWSTGIPPDQWSCGFYVFADCVSRHLYFPIYSYPPTTANLLTWLTCYVWFGLLWTIRCGGWYLTRVTIHKEKCQLITGQQIVFIIIEYVLKFGSLSLLYNFRDEFTTGIYSPRRRTLACSSSHAMDGSMGGAGGGGGGIVDGVVACIN